MRVFGSLLRHVRAPRVFLRAAYLWYRSKRRRGRGHPVRCRVADVPAFLARLDAAGAENLVLRWFDEVPIGSAEVERFRGDVDVLVREAPVWDVACAAAQDPGPVAVELRSVDGSLSSYAGMPYYPPTLAAEMLASRVLHPRGFHVPGPGLRVTSLLFHLCYQKAEASGLPTGCALPTGTAKRDYAEKLRAFATECGETLPTPLTLTSLHDELERRSWALELDLLTRWPDRSPWIEHLTAQARIRYCVAAARLPDLLVIILREDIPAVLEAELERLVGKHLRVLRSDRLDAEQILRVRRHLRGGSWHVRAGAPPAGPTRVLVCLPRAHAHGSSRGGIPRPQHCKVSIRKALRRVGADLGVRCRHGLHGSDDAFEAHHALSVIYGEQTQTVCRELAELLGRQEGSRSQPSVPPSPIAAP